MSVKRQVLVTGGSGGLGSAVVSDLKERGWEVVAPSRAELDVVKREEIELWMKKLDRLDAVVHAAGWLDDELMLKMEGQQWDGLMEVHLRSSFLLLRAALPLLRVGDGQVILIGSYSGVHGAVGQAAYAAAKAGLIGLAMSFAREEGQHGVRCNVVLPGFLETRMTEELLQDEGFKNKILSAHVLGKLNVVSEAARFIGDLLSYDMISGQVFQLDSRVG
jgi:NAD(P)-dependent dehydrogenase (short-subunit alcohol dehydrogenase family)